LDLRARWQDGILHPGLGGGFAALPFVPRPIMSVRMKQDLEIALNALERRLVKEIRNWKNQTLRLVLFKTAKG
jgi:hypothetical protein